MLYFFLPKNYAKAITVANYLKVWSQNVFLPKPLSEFLQLKVNYDLGKENKFWVGLLGREWEYWVRDLKDMNLIKDDKSFEGQ